MRVERLGRGNERWRGWEGGMRGGEGGKGEWNERWRGWEGGMRVERVGRGNESGEVGKGE